MWFTNNCNIYDNSTSENFDNESTTTTTTNTEDQEEIALKDMKFTVFNLFNSNHDSKRFKSRKTNNKNNKLSTTESEESDEVRINKKKNKRKIENKNFDLPILPEFFGAENLDENKNSDSETSSFYDDRIPESELEYFSTDWSEDQIKDLLNNEINVPPSKRIKILNELLNKYEPLDIDTTEMLKEKNEIQLRIKTEFERYCEMNKLIKSLARYEFVNSMNLSSSIDEAELLMSLEVLDKKLHRNYYYKEDEPEIFKILLEKRLRAISRKYVRYAYDEKFRDSQRNFDFCGSDDSNSTNYTNKLNTFDENSLEKDNEEEDKKSLETFVVQNELPKYTKNFSIDGDEEIFQQNDFEDLNQNEFYEGNSSKHVSFDQQSKYSVDMMSNENNSKDIFHMLSLENLNGDLEYASSVTNVSNYEFSAVQNSILPSNIEEKFSFRNESLESVLSSQKKILDMREETFKNLKTMPAMERKISTEISRYCGGGDRIYDNDIVILQDNKRLIDSEICLNRNKILPFFKDPNDKTKKKLSEENLSEYELNSNASSFNEYDMLLYRSYLEENKLFQEFTVEGNNYSMIVLSESQINVCYQ